ncbi:protein related to integral membrane protein PTH11 [Ophiocordyceps camponoti-floridani]|uniref:Protein related to integral membrane protein PTH11 n=1 Tax=Ophiocordyceps camponoti-floridani TaxID=2030778 RepID=A0A8H4Q3V1_9HYPO|nr:protein related to integral membrane protein PTH11 [Ophiocordyceps camponoti-floridani]
MIAVPDKDVPIEFWTNLTLGTLLILARVVVRWRTQTFRGLAVDDFLMAAVIPISLAGAGAGYVVEADTEGLSNAGMTPEERASLDPASREFQLRTMGSMFHIYGWILYTTLLWILKLSWLFYYKRLGERVDNMALKVKLGFAFIAVSYLVVLFSTFLGCRPFSKYWQINPDPENFCHPSESNLLAWVVLWTDLTTDFYIIAIPLPMIWRTRISMRKKIGLMAMFGGGIMTIIMGALRCGFILVEGDVGGVAARWSDREVFVAIVLSTIPVLLPIFRQRFWPRKNKFSSARSASNDVSASRPPEKAIVRLTTVTHQTVTRQSTGSLMLDSESLRGDVDNVSLPIMMNVPSLREGRDEAGDKV